MKLIIVRHTQTDWNAVRRIQGHVDRPLNATGRKQARALAQTLRNLGAHTIISSDLQRAQQTAAILNETLQLPLTIDARLRESSFGEIEGMTREQAVAHCGRWVAPYFHPECYDYDFRSIGGEHGDTVFTRHKALLDEQHKKNPDAVLMLVAHARGLRTLLGRLGHPPKAPEQGTYMLINYPE
ncbi:MAG: hypothetical protein A3F54_02395 [Candidatus Kerfeldbacteria bacterium RIFCSPHIGHO2_12_FULL_48_17]|uniref:Phosphoglycerate mutase n=1 Tax=Candidatus Kerfeldbacteria bacterium RIFCSPHIGHO2_12_FULL_48_17 TaxID=1798542 RepID=A0A1G2B8S9_9BACT|nr:MAG: hypothetical protein A3F54_02395 [Candidatus Kerfeldbacteria bacterium RIFCSPHIGHO2_12_FULL_48_17]